MAKNVIDNLNKGLFDRDECIRVLMLGLLTGQNVLVLGPPGTTKSKVVTDLFNRVKVSSYKNVLHASISPETLVGPVDLNLLKTKSQISVNTNGMLPTAELVFLDEVFKASRNVLSILLSILNERIFVNGPVSQSVPLHFTVGASNEVFFDPAQSSLLNRFPLRVLVDGRDKKMRRELTKPALRKTRPHQAILCRRTAAVANAAKTAAAAATAKPDSTTKLDLLNDVFASLEAADQHLAEPLPTDVQTLLFALVDYVNRLDLAVYCGGVIRNRGIVMFSDMVRIMAYLHGRPKTPCIFDLYPLVYMAWRTNDQRMTASTHIVAAITVALPELVKKHGAAFAYAAIRDHLFVPDAVKVVLMSHLLPHMIRAGLGNEALEVPTYDSRVDPSVDEMRAIELAVALNHAGLLARLRVDYRVKIEVEKWEKNRAERAAREAAENRRLADQPEAQRALDGIHAHFRAQIEAKERAEEAEKKRRMREQLEQEHHRLSKILQVYDETKRALTAEWNRISAEHTEQFETLSEKAKTDPFVKINFRRILDDIERVTTTRQLEFKKEAVFNRHSEIVIPSFRKQFETVQQLMESQLLETL
ncbi:hypothetical protein GGF31_002649 [Allomyces arbusculus]|nr:hypothetical protein GGF31_002649 [Allomyces arbusculus]